MAAPGPASGRHVEIPEADDLGERLADVLEAAVLEAGIDLP